MCKVSVIIPVYNTQKYLRECLDSVINQTFRDIEIIIIDDGSKDGSPQICDEYAERDSRVRVLHKQNEGLCAARNDGIRMACASRILFVDSDDYVLPSHIENLYIEGLGKYDITKCGNVNNVTHDKWEVKNPFIMPYGYNENDDNVLKNREEHCFSINIRPDFKKEGYFGSPWSMLYSRELIVEKSIFFDEDIRIREDAFFNLKYISYVKRIIPIHSFTYCYRTVSEGITKGYNSKYEDWENVWKDKLLEYIKTDKSYLKRVVYLEITFQYLMNIDRFYFNPNNKDSFFRKLDCVKRYINQSDVKQIFSEVDLSCIQLSGKIAVLAARTGSASLVGAVYIAKTAIKKILNLVCRKSKTF